MSSPTPSRLQRPSLPAPEESPAANEAEQVAKAPAMATSDRHRRRWFFQLPLLILAAASLLAWLLPPLPLQWATVPFLISLIVLGMPYGAADFAVALGLYEGRFRGRWLQSMLCYVALMGAMLGLLLVLPWLTLVAFAGLTAWHFGHADLADLRDRTRDPLLEPRSRWSGLWILARGGFILGLPFTLQPQEALGTFRRMLVLLGDPLSDVAATLTVAMAGLLTATSLAALVALMVGQIRHAQWPSVRIELAETAVLALAFLSLHPLLAVGLYFLAWHSWRHFARLVDFFRQIGRLAPCDGSSARAGWLTGVWWLHVWSLPFLVPTLALFVALALAVLPDWNLTDLAVLTLAFFVVVTPSHHVLIERVLGWLDRRRPGRTAAG